jgi:tetratricopeptide (TPR) repeat protein
MSDLDTYARAGIEAVNEQKFDLAIENFQKALAIDPDRPDLNNALGMAYMNRGEVVSAVPHLERAITLAEPYDAPEHQDMKRHFETALATAYTVLDRIQDARRVFEGAARRWPGDLETRMQLGSLLVSACMPREGQAVYREIVEDERFEDEIREAADALSGAIDAFLDDENLQASVFLEAHAESYDTFFAQHTHELVDKGFIAEAARMVRGEDGEPKPMLPEGARPWAFERIDLVEPGENNVAKVGDERDPLIVAVNGLEPLAQVPVALPWEGHPFEVFVSSRCPWHWLTIAIQLRDPRDPDGLVEAVDETVGAWYLAGYNGDFGEADKGRFHFATAPDFIGDRAIAYTVDLGRTRFEAISDLLKRLTILHDRVPLQRVLFGQGRLPDA